MSTGLFKMELGAGEQLFFGGGGPTVFFSILGTPNDTCLNTSDFIKKKNHNGHLLKCRTIGLSFYIFTLLCVLALQVSPLCLPSKCFLKYSSWFVF